MDNNEQVRPKDLLRLGHYSKYTAALNAMKRVRDEFGIRPHGKVFWWQYVTVYNSGVSLSRLIQIFNKANGEWQWKEIVNEIKEKQNDKTDNWRR